MGSGQGCKRLNIVCICTLNLYTDMFFFPTEGDIFYDFLFASLKDETLPNKDLLLNERTSFWRSPSLEGQQNVNHGFISLEFVSFLL